MNINFLNFFLICVFFYLSFFISKEIKFLMFIGNVIISVFKSPIYSSFRNSKSQISSDLIVNVLIKTPILTEEQITILRTLKTVK
jgi:hypothetical protein